MKRNEVKEYLNELESYLKEFEKKTGLSFKINSTSYTANDFTCKINFTTLSEEEVYNKKSTFFGKVPFGTKISYKGDIYKVVDYKARATKYPYIVENDSHKRYKVDENWINLYKIAE